MTESIQERSMAIHRKLRGKIEVRPKEAVTKENLGLFYTPGVGAVSSHIAEHPEDADALTLRGNTVAVVSDGSAVLGLGNIGSAAALPVMEGKAMLFKALANVDAFPIVLNTQDTESIIETVKNLEPSFGAVNLEDIAAPRCFEIERRLQSCLRIPVMHDDQHGTAMVVLSGLINALSIRGSKKEEVKVVINGAGAAGTAIVKLLLTYGFRQVVMVDSSGVIYAGREGMTPEKSDLAIITNTECLRGELADAVRGADVFIGVSKGGALTEVMVQSMNDRPIVFALANPIPEIYPEDALRAGAFVVATGRSDFPNQINNALGFPGIFRGALDNKVTSITDEMLIEASKRLASVVEHPTPEYIIPSVFDERVVPAVASAIR